LNLEKISQVFFVALHRFARRVALRAA